MSRKYKKKRERENKNYEFYMNVTKCVLKCLIYVIIKVKRVAAAAASPPFSFSLYLL